ncbi:alpha-2,8-sialyltransferase 8B-like [Asterias amurensis]|uniref:alpha-2,8-sialyltransferase 8B-like n=1 Tax=Asterias amurensis TaxID=7602 RepID=UPI003AB63C6D
MDAFNTMHRNKRVIVVVCVCVATVGFLLHNKHYHGHYGQVPDQRISYKLGGGSALINMIRLKDKMTVELDQQTNKDMDTEKRWGLGEKGYNRPMDQGRKLINVEVLAILETPEKKEKNWSDYEDLLLNWKWKPSQTNLTRVREELKAHHVDIRYRLLTSNATMKEGQVMTMYLSGQNASLTPVFAQQQDKVSPFKGKEFKKCSVVGNSGLLVNSMCGFAVDDAEYVFRINVPEMDPYVLDVGFKTDFTTLNPSIFKRKYNYFGSQQLTDKFNSDMAQFQGILMLPCFSDEAWMPICSRALQRLTPKKYLKVAFGDPQQFSLIRDYWVTKGLSKYPSTGLYLVTAAIALCNEVHLYGFWPFVESNLPHVTTHPVKYHYFDNSHMVRTHDMHAEFDQLTRLHQEGVLKIHIQNCEDAEKAEKAKQRVVSAHGISIQSKKTVTARKFNLEKMWGD